MTEVQYWLAELDQYGNPKLIDGAHATPEGANRDAYLISAMKLGCQGRRFAVAKVELSDCVPTVAGVDMKAVQIINMAQKRNVERNTRCPD